MFQNLVAKCIKVSDVADRDIIETHEGDVVYVRNHPHVYVNRGEGKWETFQKVYAEEGHPKYNIDKLERINEPYIFKVDYVMDLNAIPAKSGDLIYRTGDTFMYVKNIVGGNTAYGKIYKVK